MCRLGNGPHDSCSAPRGALHRPPAVHLILPAPFVPIILEARPAVLFRVNRLNQYMDILALIQRMFNDPSTALALQYATSQTKPTTMW